MQTLPAEQNKLLKLLNDIDSQERSGIIPVRSNVNLVLIFFVWALTGFLCGISVYIGKPQEVVTTLISSGLVTVTLTLAYYNKSVGMYAASIITVLGSTYSTFFFTQPTDLATLFNGITIFIIANQFFTKGYIVGSVIIIAKVLLLYFINGEQASILTVVASLISALTIGFIPVLMLSISKVSIRAKKQEIRAEILSLQNQDLISSWGDLYSRGAAPTTSTPIQTTPPVPTPPTDPAQPIESDPDGSGLIYQSQYSPSN